MALPPPRGAGTALVTGASSGIGAEIARALAAGGYGVTLVARREDRLLQLAAELTAAHGVRAGVLPCDLGKQTERDRLAEEVERLELDVDVLVNNAGFGFSGDFADGGRERQLAMVALNCDAVLDLCGRYLPGMKTRGSGAVINIASTAAFQPLPGTAAYAATKAFVLSFSEGISQELKGSGVTVTAVCPGPVRTEFAETAGVGGSEEKLPDFFWSTPEEIAESALKAAAKGKRQVIPGPVNQVGSILGRHSPRAVSLPLSEKIWGLAE